MTQARSTRWRESMRARIKIALLYVLKYVGVFHVSRYATRRAVRILCYHGISLGDEHRFRRTLFMQSSTFRRRMEALVRLGYSVVKLDDAIEQLRNDSVRPGSVVITVDDGWYGCLSGMFPVLRELGFDATLYLTTYYAERDEPVFDVAVGYLFWKTEATSVVLDGPVLSGRVDLSTSDSRALASEAIVEHGNAHLGALQRRRLLEELARRLDVDYESIRQQRYFRLIPLDSLGALAESGVDVQLHTHRHKFDVENKEEAEREIRENRERLEPVLGKTLRHFCYPSGFYHSRVFPWLEALGIQSATTTRSGFCDSTSPLFELHRIVDGEDVSQIEIEAELAGVLELVRKWVR